MCCAAEVKTAVGSGRIVIEGASPHMRREWIGNTRQSSHEEEEIAELKVRESDGRRGRSANRKSWANYARDLIKVLRG